MKFLLVMASLMISSALLSQKTECQIAFVADGKIFNSSSDTLILWTSPRPGKEMFALKVDSILLPPRDTTKISSMEWAEEFRPPWQFYIFRSIDPELDSLLNDEDKWVFRKQDETTGYFLLSIE